MKKITQDWLNSAQDDFKIIEEVKKFVEMAKKIYAEVESKLNEKQ